MTGGRPKRLVFPHHRMLGRFKRPFPLPFWVTRVLFPLAGVMVRRVVGDGIRGVL